MLIAMMVVSIIGVVGFGMVRITIRQIRQQGSIAASSRAYQSAEAGLEYALLQYRLNKSARLGSGSLTADTLGAVWPVTYLERDLGDDQTFLVRSTNMYQRLGLPACLKTPYANITAWLGCDGQGGRTLLRMRPGDSVRITPTNASHKYLFLRGMTEAGGSVANGKIVVTGYDAAGNQSANPQKVWSLNSPTSPVTPKGGYTTVSTDLATASWFTVQYVNDSSAAAFVAAVGVSLSNTSAESGPLNFSTDRYLIEVAGRSGGISGVERRLQAVVNTRDNTIDGLYDYSQTALGTVDYVLSGGEIVTP